MDLVEKSFAFKNALTALKEVSAEMKALGLKVKLGPETMGRKSQVGTIDEILTICQEVEGTQLVIDWGHLHALHQGTLKKVEDFRAIAEKVEQKLGTETPKNHALSLLKNRVLKPRRKTPPYP